MSDMVQKKVALIFFIMLFTVTNVQAVEIDIGKTIVKYEKDGVYVIFDYNLDPVQRLKCLLFGASYIEEDILSLFENRELEIKRIDFEHAELVLPVIYFNDTAYFQGLKLNESLSEILLVFPGNSTVKLVNATEIPQAFYSIY